jgi:hypothetical protein
LKRVGPVLFDVVKVHLGLRKITRKKVGNEELGVIASGRLLAMGLPHAFPAIDVAMTTSDDQPSFV